MKATRSRSARLAVAAAVALLAATAWILGSDLISEPLFAQSGGRLDGLHRAQVVSTTDPLSRGRVQITFSHRPSYLEWALPCAPYSAQGPAGIALPPVGTEVWVEFEKGDSQRPVWMGVAY